MADFGGIAGEQLKSLIERIERLEDEKRALGEDIKEVYAEAKGTGFEPKIMRQIPQDPKNGQGRARRAGEPARHLQTRARNAARRRRNGSGRGIATPIKQGRCRRSCSGGGPFQHSATLLPRRLDKLLLNNDPTSPSMQQVS